MTILLVIPYSLKFMLSCWICRWIQMWSCLITLVMMAMKPVVQVRQHVRDIFFYKWWNFYRSFAMNMMASQSPLSLSSASFVSYSFILYSDFLYHELIVVYIGDLMILVATQLEYEIPSPSFFYFLFSSNPFVQIPIRDNHTTQ